MGLETQLRHRVMALLKECGFFAQAIESETNPGMPDVYYRKDIMTVGWLELKRVQHLPKRDSTALFTSMNHPLGVEQVNWITLERKHGGVADILVGYERDYFFIEGSYASAFNFLTWNDLNLFKVGKHDIPKILMNQLPKPRPLL